MSESIMCQTMIGPLPVKVAEAHIPDLSVVNSRYWKYTFERHEHEGPGYVCPGCGNTRVVNLPYLDSETGMVAWDQRAGASEYLRVV